MVMDVTRDPFLSRAALAGDQHRGIDRGDGLGQFHQFAHLGASRHQFRGVFLDLGDDRQLAGPLLQFAFGAFQRGGDVPQGFIDPDPLENRQFTADLLAPFFLGFDHHMAGRVALSDALVLQRVHFLVQGEAQGNR
jgi:hypothetical protein